MARDTQYVQGAQRLARRISTIRTRLALPPLVDEIGGLLLKRTLERFDREVDPFGVPWRELAPSTLRRKAALGYGSSPKLVRTREMRSAIQLIRGRADGGMFTNTGAGSRIGIVDPDVVPKARAQNRGVPGRIPARRFLGIGPLDVKAVDGFMRRKAAQLEKEI